MQVNLQEVQISSNKDQSRESGLMENSFRAYDLKSNKQSKRKKNKMIESVIDTCIFQNCFNDDYTSLFIVDHSSNCFIQLISYSS